MIPATIITFTVGVGTIIGAVAAASYRDVRYDGIHSRWSREEEKYGTSDMKAYAILNGLAAGGYLMGTLEIIASAGLLVTAIIRVFI